MYSFVVFVCVHVYVSMYILFNAYVHTNTHTYSSLFLHLFGDLSLFLQSIDSY